MKKYDVFLDSGVEVDLEDDVDPTTVEGLQKLKKAAARAIEKLLETDNFGLDWQPTQLDDEVDQDDICDSCGDPFTDNGPGQRSAVDDSICEYCYVNEENEYDDYDYVEDEDDEEERP